MIDKKQLFKRAWSIARQSHFEFGGRVKNFFPTALKKAWAELKIVKK